MLVTVISLLVTAALVALAIGATLGNGHSTSPGLTGSPGVSGADNVTAQQALSDSLTAADAAAVGGGLASLTPSALEGAVPSLTYVSGPSTNSSTVSIAIASGAVSGGGSITFAVRAATDTCWLVWKGASGATWYGAQTGLSSCTAPALAASPQPTPVSSASIGWQQGGFPAVP